MADMADMTDIDLKPCPFCGGDAILRHSHFLKYFHEWWVKCSVCQTCTNLFDKKEHAVNFWQRRVKE